MTKKWRIFIICLLLVISYSIYQSSTTNAHIDLISKALSPYSLYNDPHREISLVGADDTETIKQSIMELSDSTGVSFTLSYVISGEEHNPKYYWYLQDEKYLNTDTGLNKNIDIETFTLLDEPITNNIEDEYHFSFPLDTYSYNIYPFRLYDKSNLSTRISIFSESEENINEFINELGVKGIMYIVDDTSFNYERTFKDKIMFIMFQNPLAPLTFGLFLIAIFTLIYQDRRNLSIKLVNGYSKIKYIWEVNKTFLCMQSIIFTLGFLAYYLLSFGFNFSYLTITLFHYIPVIIVINFIVIFYVLVIVYSFTDINYNILNG